MGKASRKKRDRRQPGGGRYTPPKVRVQVPENAEEAERREFWADYGEASRRLLQRCNALLEEQVTREEWVNADLMGMDGQWATDEQLVAYWAVFRRAVELECEEPPDLRFVTDALESSEDPVVTFEKWWEDIVNDD